MAGLGAMQVNTFAPLVLVCLAVAWLANLNGPLLLASYYSMWWLQPLLIIPFLRGNVLLS